jgi:hypothetical protein
LNEALATGKVVDRVAAQQQCCCCQTTADIAAPPDTFLRFNKRLKILSSAMFAGMAMKGRVQGKWQHVTQGFCNVTF